MKVLVVDDEKEFLSLVSEALTNNSYTVQVINTGEQIFTDVAVLPEIILLDFSLPGKSGLQILKELRQHNQFKNIPVIMVTGHHDDQNAIHALNAGADDYVTKPFRFSILDARIKAVLRRSNDRIEDGVPESLCFLNLTVDTAAHQALLENQEIKFTLTEFKILSELVRRQGQAVTREQLRERVLMQPTLSDRTLDVHMTAIRKKLKDLGKHLVTVRGVGYRLTTDTTLA